MLRLILKAFSDCEARTVDLHSNMLRLIHQASNLTTQTKVNLHSNMLRLIHTGYQIPFNIHY